MTQPTTGPALTNQVGGLSFPRHYARTQRFTLGQPRSARVAADGSRVVFLRSGGGTDPVTGLWVYDVGRRSERQVVDPRALPGLTGGAGADGEDLPPVERARRERARETAGGVVGYACDPAARVAAFALSGRLFTADLVGGDVVELPAGGPVVDPRPDPTGSRVAYVTDGALHVVERSGGGCRVLVAEDDPDVTWGLAEFVAAEEMDRLQGFWWSPDGARLLVARVDSAPVQRWHIADPANPGTLPQEIAYPAAGTPNAVVTLAVVDIDGARVDVDLDTDAFPYLVTASWREGAPATVLVQSRDQRRMQVRTVDPVTGATTLVREETDLQWLGIVPGVPSWLADGRLVWVADRDGSGRLFLGEEAVTPTGLQVSAVLGVEGDTVLVAASEEPTESHVHRVHADGRVERLTDAPGLHHAVGGGGVVVTASSSLDRFGTQWRVHVDGQPAGELAAYPDIPTITPNVTLLTLGRRELRTAVLLPREDVRPSGPLPVLMDPYAGPHAQRVLKARNAFLASQWLADQGFAVVVCDGRGTPNRGPAWERAVHHDLATPVLQDQVDALYAVAEAYPGELDLSRVGVRGWSFGGYLAALAVLRRPDVFHAAVAGAPVTDWRLYDTHYTERYLGHPDVYPEVYDRSSLLADAERLTRPLMIIHGLADDNVAVAHTLRLSSALLAAGRPHTVLPLSGVTHMTPQEVVAENLLLLQVAFLRDALGL